MLFLICISQQHRHTMTIHVVFIYANVCVRMRSPGISVGDTIMSHERERDEREKERRRKARFSDGSLRGSDFYSCRCSQKHSTKQHLFCAKTFIILLRVTNFRYSLRSSLALSFAFVFQFRVCFWESDLSRLIYIAREKYSVRLPLPLKLSFAIEWKMKRNIQDGEKTLQNGR